MNKKSVVLSALLVVSLLAVPMAGCTKPLTLSITSPADGKTFDQPQIEVRANVSDAKATVWVNDTVAPVTKYRTGGGGWVSTKFDLNEGENTITVTAARGKPDNWKDIVQRTVTVTYSVEKPLTIELGSPEDEAELTESLVAVTGKVSDPAVQVIVNGMAVEVTEDGSFSASVELVEGENIITVVAFGKQTATRTLTVTYAPPPAPETAEPPALSLEITSPEDGATVTESPVTVSGVVSDPGATITVNDVLVELAEDGTFSADVELIEGKNIIMVVATLEEETLSRELIVTYTP